MTQHGDDRYTQLFALPEVIHNLISIEQSLYNLSWYSKIYSNNHTIWHKVLYYCSGPDVVNCLQISNFRYLYCVDKVIPDVSLFKKIYKKWWTETVSSYVSYEKNRYLQNAIHNYHILHGTSKHDSIDRIFEQVIDFRKRFWFYQTTDICCFGIELLLIRELYCLGVDFSTIVCCSGDQCFTLEFDWNGSRRYVSYTKLDIATTQSLPSYIPICDIWFCKSGQQIGRSIYASMCESIDHNGIILYSDFFDITHVYTRQQYYNNKILMKHYGFQPLCYPDAELIKIVKRWMPNKYGRKYKWFIRKKR
jgi:hypothetical protein